MNNYKKAGVDIDRANEFISAIKPYIKKTYNKNVLDYYGGFAAFYDLEFLKKYKHPILVTTTDGVGSKLKIAIMAAKFDTVGIDLVAMNVNDLLVAGARPLVFLDYIATGKLDVAQLSEIVKGISKGCKLADVSLVGGETAEMPSLYRNKDFDLAGFCAGVIEKDHIIDGSNVKEGDVVVGLPSSGFHSNGYALIRQILFKENNFSLDYKINKDTNLVDILLEPTKIYKKTIDILVDNDLYPKSMSHITGGGFYDNISRVIPGNVDVVLDPASWERPKCYDFLIGCTHICEIELFRVFNMGIGLTMIVDIETFKKIELLFNKYKEMYFKIGDVIRGNGKVIIKGVDIK
jgi:phosphoribosylformylglycinamidine cyclo-ligase